MLNDYEVGHLHNDGQALWLNIEEFAVAYHARYQAKSSLSVRLSYATIVAGICTAVSTIPEAQQYISTAIPAVLTAIIAAISQILSPEKIQRETWETLKKIRSLKSDLESRCRGLYLAESYSDEQIVFQGFSKHLESILIADITVSELHRKNARSNFAMANITPRKSTLTSSTDTLDDISISQESTSNEGVQVMTRRVVTQ